jgi:putative membrane protein
MADFAIAYCGRAAVPEDVWIRWNGDPWLLATLAGLALAVALGYSRSARAGWTAIALLFAVFVSPLCALASALFSARVLHHVLLVAGVAPILAVAFPWRRLGSLPLAALVAADAVVLWFWHAPTAYAWGLSTVPAYWLMQVTLLGTSWLLWRSILSSATPPAAALLALGTTIAQMGLLGALIAFAPRPLYVAHFASTAAWGLTPLADQQLAGLLMWVPASLPYLVVGLKLAWTSLQPVGQPR